MPKPLSLKKNQQTSKNQKPITQFFKNENNKQLASVDSRQGLHKSSTSVIDNSTSNKRKASPNQSKHWNNEFDQEENAKKIKIDGKKTPQKENNNKLLNLSEDLTLPQQQDNQEHKVTRSPLSLITDNDDLNGIQSNLSPTKLQNNHCEEISSNVKYSKNHVENETTNHEHNIFSKYVTPKKSPHRGTSKSPKSVSKVLTFGKLSTEESAKKSPAKIISKSPKRISPFLTFDKLTAHELSPSKSGSTVDTLNNEDIGDDLFGDDWELNNVEEIDEVEDLDLRIMQRCEITKVINHGTRIEINLKTNNKRGTCFIEGCWMDTPLCPRDIVGVIASRDAAGQFCVSNTSGLLTLRPDHLISSTSVVAGVFCKRKAVLQERWRGIDSANAAMTLGIIIHELVQKALTEIITDTAKLRLEAQKIIKESIQLLYDAGLTEEEVQNNMQVYIPSLADFMTTYVSKSAVAPMQKQKDKWNGKINKVLDIEENLCCPQLGLKGKIDATLEVTVHAKKGVSQEVVPLELKSGKASMSAEHRGQLVLYGMMLSALRGGDPSNAEQRGLLLYLKDRVELREISCGYPERRDLMMLRNQLVQNLAAGPEDVDPEQLVDIEDASVLLQQKLPEPIHRENICSKCPYLTICSLHLWHTDGPSVSDTHPLSTLRETALGHLTQDHVKYFLKWTTLLKIEEKGQSVASPLHSLWTDSVEKREKRGTCAGNLQLKSVEGSGVKFLHVFCRNLRNGALKCVREFRGLQEGDFCIVSLDNRPWIAAGVIVCADDSEIHMLLERDLSRRSNKSTAFHIDAYESYGSTVQNFTNLGVLLDDTDRSERLRRLIIDKEKPLFEPKLPREVGRLGTKLMRSLNIQQQRAVLRALAAKHYALLKGLPGTGKTQTVSVLIQMLVGLKQRVLVTAHTHSAVDNVLARLPESIRVMRLGAKSRVSPDLVHRCEDHLAADCDTTLKLEQLYDSMEVVGVTCLGATHAMLSRITFDVCIVDEATQVLQSTVLRPLFAANRFILVGDPEQLPPVVRSRAARRLGMEESLFHRLMSDEATCTLQLQYRMNKPLADVANKVAYGGQLQCAGDTVALARMNMDLKKISHLTETTPWLSTACSPNSEQAAVFLDLASETTDDDVTNSCSNKTEASLVLALVHALIEGGIKSSDIGVVAPYRDQVALLKRSLSGRVEASTVDQFQGRDKSVIIYSCTKKDGQEEKKVKDSEILNDQRRLAVSVTRAKHKLIIIGSSRALARYAPLQRLIDACVAVTLDANEIKQFSNKYKDHVM